MGSWKRTANEYHEELAKELDRGKVLRAVISTNVPLNARMQMTKGIEPRDVGSLKKNQNLRTVLAEHDGHKLSAWIDDYEYGTEGDTLYGMGSYGSRGFPILERVSEYEHINLWDDRK